jgi:nitroreductase
MDVYDAVRTVLAVRNYQDKVIPAEVIRKIVEAGRLTASSMNLQPWHFIVVTERETLKELGALARTGPYIAQAPAAVAVAVEKKSKFGVSDASRAIQSMILTAWSEGVGSNWVGFGGLEAVGTRLGVPDDFEVLAIVPLGYPAGKKLGRGRKNRKPLSEVARRGRFSQPFD